MTGHKAFDFVIGSLGAAALAVVVVANAMQHSDTIMSAAHAVVLFLR